MKQIEVVAAVIFKDNKIFATQRGYGEFKGWWEFPGGKIEIGETQKEALIREIREELDAKIDIQNLIKTIEYDYPNFHLTMHCYKCYLIDGEQLKLLEHDNAMWISKDEINNINWLPADIQIIDDILNLL